MKSAFGGSPIYKAKSKIEKPKTDGKKQMKPKVIKMGGKK